MNKKNISLRVDDELMRELEFIMKSLDANISTSIKEAIHTKYHEIKLQGSVKRKPAEVLEASGFIGSIQGESNWSTDHKSLNLKSLRKKHG